MANNVETLDCIMTISMTVDISYAFTRLAYSLIGVLDSTMMINSGQWKK